MGQAIIMIKKKEKKEKRTFCYFTTMSSPFSGYNELNRMLSFAIQVKLIGGTSELIRELILRGVDNLKAVISDF